MANPLFTCPPPAALTSIPTQECPERFDQVVKFAFRRRSGAVAMTSSSIILSATWTPLMSASDDTKVVVSPYIANVVIPTGELVKEGGNDNTTINGIPRLAGKSIVAVTAAMEDVNAAVRAAFNALTGESAVMPGFTNLEFVMFNRFGQIIANTDGTWIPVYNVAIGDVGSEGFNKTNKSNVSFDLEGGWSDDITVFTPTAPFNPLNLANS